MELSKMSKEDLRALAEDLAKKYNEAYQGQKYDEAIDINEEMEQVVNCYTNKSREEVMAYLIGCEDPMLEAIKMLEYDTIRIKDSKIGEAKIPVRDVIDAKKPIDLAKLDKMAGGIGHDKKWINMGEAMNRLMTIKVAKDLGIDASKINDSYRMQEASKAIKFGKDPTSNTQLVKTLQTVISAMVGEEYRANMHDVKYLIHAYGRRGKVALTIACSNHTKFRQYLAEICHRIVLNKVYDIDYKKIVNK